MKAVVDFAAFLYQNKRVRSDIQPEQFQCTSAGDGPETGCLSVLVTSETEKILVNLLQATYLPPALLEEMRFGDPLDASLRRRVGCSVRDEYGVQARSSPV
jgi:hypothetical protein